MTMDKIVTICTHIIGEWNTLVSTIDRRKDWLNIGPGCVKMNIYTASVLLNSNNFLFYNTIGKDNEIGILNGMLCVYIDNNLSDYEFDIYWSENYPFHTIKTFKLNDE